MTDPHQDGRPPHPRHPDDDDGAAAAAFTRLLRRAGDGDGAAAADLLPLVYDQLRRLAAHRMAGERAAHTLGATALVHEAYLRLVGPAGGGGAGDAGWANRAHFFHAAAEAMRRVLVDHARGRGRLKRGGGEAGVRRSAVPLHALNVADLAAGADPDEVVALDAAFARLERHSPGAAAVVRLRFYAGLGVREAAAALGVSTSTVDREWAYARAWLFRELGGGG